jgi:hypothetical protein
MGAGTCFQRVVAGRVTVRIWESLQRLSIVSLFQRNQNLQHALYRYLGNLQKNLSFCLMVCSWGKINDNPPE